MAFQAWVWPRTDEPVFGPASGPGPGWQCVGEVTTESAPDLMKVVQRRLGQRGGADPASVTGYIEGFADHEWVRALNQATPDDFFIAFGPVGNVGAIYLVSRLPAMLATPARRAPEPHPGRLTPPVYVGVRLHRHEGMILDRRDYRTTATLLRPTERGRELSGDRQLWSL
jgi:hypothetical protein